MNDLILMLEKMLEENNIQFLLITITFANILDFTVGFLNAILNDEIEFNSGVAIRGITRKIMVLLVLILFIPVSMVIPVVGTTSLYVLYTGYLIAEVNSVLAQLGLTNDEEKNHIFIEMMKKLMGGNKND